MKKKKVVLFFPAYASNEACPPLALIAIAGPLITAGYEVKIIDTAMEQDFVGAVMREVEDALCLGISLVTGPMIKGAIAVGSAVKARHPDLPVILGGWHPSILPQQTLDCPYVDAVVVRQGELTFLELIKRLECGEALTGLAGTWTKERGTITQNPPRSHTPVAMLPSRMPGYGLIDYERYFRATGLRWLMYTSFGHFTEILTSLFKQAFFTDSATANATARVKSNWAEGARNTGRSTMLMVRFSPGALCHSLPRCPRPAD